MKDENAPTAGLPLIVFILPPSSFIPFWRRRAKWTNEYFIGVENGTKLFPHDACLTHVQ